MVFFSQIYIFLVKCAPFLSKIREDLNIDVSYKKWKKLKLKFIAHLNIFDSNVFYALKFIKFEDVHLTKVIHHYVSKMIIT
jgi:hypothetical protein